MVRDDTVYGLCGALSFAAYLPSTRILAVTLFGDAAGGFVRLGIGIHSMFAIA